MDTGFLLLIAGGAAGGWLFDAVHIPGGSMLGAVIGAMLIKLSGLNAMPTPHSFQIIAQIGMGIVVGNMLTSSLLAEIRAMLPLMAITTGLLLAAGFLGSWLVYRATGMDIPSAILATSPGGLNAVVGLAADMGNYAPMVMAFQMVRLYTVVLLSPLISWALHAVLK
ncbi:MAG: AbrB family transcriptional regulator [Desulfovibrionaceae bacterium]|nr:AbrB family transcriptional regulator [Desulfovibrionaceae bacterium]